MAATRRSLASDLAAMGLAAGDSVLAHAALRKVGTIIGGPDTLIAAIADVLGREGTLLAYCDWQGQDDIDAGTVDQEDIPPFDPERSRALRDNGAFPELLRTTPGARRSASPGASCAALGGRSRWFTADHAHDYGYGPQSPFGKLVEAEGKTLLIGAPYDTMTLLHHAEHLADIPNKRVLRYEAPILVGGDTVWRQVEEFDTSNPVVEGLDDNYFATVVTDYLATGAGQTGRIGRAESVIVDAADVVRFAVGWLERRFGA